MGYSDYVKNTAGANGGQMLIRVADSVGQAGVIGGNEVQFFVRAGLTATWVGTPGFATRAFVNGGWVNLARVQNHRNSTSWIHLGTVNIGSNQTVTLHIDASGTQGFGGPDDFAVNVSRARVPDAPTPVSVTSIGHQSFIYSFSGGWDGGSPTLEHQIGYGYLSTQVQYTYPSNGTTPVATFIPGATVYIWARSRNAVGWGPWSARTTVELYRGCRVKSKGVWVHAIPYVKQNGVWRAAEPYLKQGKVPGGSNGTWERAAYTG